MPAPGGPAIRPFASWLVDWMQQELQQRQTEYLDNRKQAHRRFSSLVMKMQDELFHYRSTNTAMQLLQTVDQMVIRLKAEDEELRNLEARWRS